MEDQNRYLMCLKTVQAPVIKGAIDDIKDLLSETNIHVNQSGLHILDMDESHTVLVHLTLNADRFEYFHCARPITIGINMNYLSRILKNTQSNDTLEFFVNENEENMVGIRLSNANKSQVDTYQIRRMDIDEVEYEFPDQDYEHIINMPASDFQQICRSSKSVSTQTNNKVMDIVSYNGELTFTVEGDIGNKVTRRQSGASDNTNLQYTKRDDVIYQGSFNLEKLTEFSKFANIGGSQNTVQMMMKNEHPIIFNYPVAALGQIVLLLAPRNANE